MTLPETPHAVCRQIPDEFVHETQHQVASIRADLRTLMAATGDTSRACPALQSMRTVTNIIRFLSLPDMDELGQRCQDILETVAREQRQPSEAELDTLHRTCDLLEDWMNCSDAADQDLWESLLERSQQLLDQGTLPDNSVVPAFPAAPGQPTSGATVAVAPISWPAAAAGLAPDLVRGFSVEAVEHLQQIEAELLKLEANPGDSESIRSIFRAIHSIKGTADYVGLAQIKCLSHHTETVLDLARGGHLVVDSGLLSVVFSAVDALGNMVASLQDTGESPVTITDLLAELQSLQAPLRVTESKPATSAAASPAADKTTNVFLQAAEQHIESIRVQARKLVCQDDVGTAVGTLRRSAQTLLSTSEYMGISALAASCRELIEQLEHVAPLAAQDRDVPGKDTAPGKDTDSAIPADVRHRIENVCAQIADRFTSLKSGPVVPSESDQPPRGTSTPPAKDQDARGGQRRNGQPGAKSIRVDQVKLDEYISLAGELVIARNALTHVFRDFERGTRGDAGKLKSAIDAVDRITGAVQDNAMAMRMVPVTTVFQRFPRVVRDIARSQHKLIELQMLGEETEIDKQVAEALGDPLVHLVRNSADHGIELPEERQAAGKSDTGLITLKAGREGNSVIIDIIDDGAGIDVNRLKAKALEHGLIDADTAETMPAEEALQLVFAAGLSTAKQVTDVSGRGVGMDVVKTNIRNLGGTVSVSSEPGEGTQMRIRLPLTLAVTTGLLIASDNNTYALPLDVVQETVKVFPASLNRLNQCHAITIKDQIVPVRSLHSVLKDGSAGQDRQPSIELPAIDASGRVTIVVVRVGNDLHGLAVDRVLGQQEIVLKPLPGFLASIPGLGSATVMGDGSVVLILDPKTLQLHGTASG